MAVPSDDEKDDCAFYYPNHVTRLDESRCAYSRIGIKLGYITQTSSRTEQTPLESDFQSGQEEDSEHNSHPNEINGHNSLSTDHDERESRQNQTSSLLRRSIKPPQAPLPKFFGKPEEFPEYWAIFETLVHKNEELDVIEKIILLKQSLKGRAKSAIQGIQPLPQNYGWIITTLKETYCDYSTNRSQIVQKLVGMKEAANFADSCLFAFEQIQVLIKEMVSAGHDVRNTCDPM
ncbi:hypothetical protein TELCIR_12191 [Teladorsagia circumcincta]|uniref:Uncharacterized protein n=1 Tax=Teladorsagia circumcincta TaxID=45464 RepID=A0A2G9U7D0_TELCI|nr:hypothetical protein TELCIR_12191 [Teladorsagia circumcincta]